MNPSVHHPSNTKGKSSVSESFRDGDWIAGTPYRVVRTLGVGGMGQVYEVDHTKTGTRRAIKVVRASLGVQHTLGRRLVREGTLLRRVTHQNVVRVYEVGKLPDGRPYFAMELLDGFALRKLTRKHVHLPWRRAVSMIIQVLDGVAAIHEQNLIHRDIKPSNLFLDPDGTVKVLDLGIAKPLDPCDSGPRTRTGVVLGTIRYMAPEQWLGESVDARTDVYAAALVLFELLTGAHPADGAGWEGPLDRLEGPPPRVSWWATEPIPAGLDAVVARALARSPDDRYSDAACFARALRAFVPVPRPVPPTVVADAAKLSRGSPLCCVEPTDMPTRSPIRYQASTPRFRWWPFLHAASLITSIVALALAIGLTWLATRDRRWESPTCSGTTIDQSSPSHIGVGAGAR